MIQRMQDNRFVLLGAVGIFSLGLVLSGYLLGDGLRRAKAAERSVSVRGVSERDVTADLATWSLDFSDAGTSLEPVQASADAKGRAIRSFLAKAGFKPAEVSDSGISASQNYDKDRREDVVTVSRSIQLRSRDVMRVRNAFAQQADLIREGVKLSSSNVRYSFTGLNALKPAMIAEANQAARRNAEQFAHDSGADVGRIKSASQGYFAVGPRDGDAEEEGGAGNGSGSPLQKVRVVTSVDYDLG